MTAADAAFVENVQDEYFADRNFRVKPIKISEDRFIICTDLMFDIGPGGTYEGVLPHMDDEAYANTIVITSEELADYQKDYQTTTTLDNHDQ